MNLENEKEIFFEYLNSKQFKHDFLNNINLNFKGGKDMYFNQSNTRRTKKEQAELNAKKEEVTSILFTIVRELKNLIFSLIPIPLPIPEAIKDQIGSKGQIDTLWDSHIAPFISNLTNSSKYGKRSNIKTPFTKIMEEENELKDEMEEIIEKENEILKIEKNIENNEEMPEDLDEDPSEIMGGNLKSLQNLKQLFAGKSICWSGYHRVPGTAPYSKHSCVKN